MTERVFTTSLPTTRDTGREKLPGLPAVPATGIPGLDTWLRQVSEVIEVNNGSRGSGWGRVVTVREFAEAVKAVEKMAPAFEAVSGGGINGGPMSSAASAMVDKLTASIMNLQVFKDLQMRLDDPRRFDRIAAEVREVLLSDLAKEAAKRGAAILRLEKIVQDANRSLAFEVKTITAAVQQSQAGIRSVEWALAETNLAQAGKITQITASLGNYYQDGTPGRVDLEQQMVATADAIDGLHGQYTLKVQAGGALAGFGLSATEKDGVPDSAFIISADKFAVVAPSYSGGLTQNPPVASVPFGVDANGIYLNNNVYVRGQMRVDAGGKTLIDGLRGSVDALQQTGAWSDTTARNMVWTRIGKSGTPTNNNHLVIGDQVTIGTTTRYWNGSSWADTGVVIRGDMIVDGTVAAAKVDTRGLTIKDANGSVIFSSGVPLDYSRVSGLGWMATRDKVNIGWHQMYSDITVDSQPLTTSDFISKYARLSNGNFSTFIDNVLIGNATIASAFIGEASVDTLRIREEAVTVTVSSATSGSNSVAAGGVAVAASVSVTVPAGATGILIQAGAATTSGSNATIEFAIRVNGVDRMIRALSQDSGWWRSNSIAWSWANPPAGTHAIQLRLRNPTSGPGSNQAFTYDKANIAAMGGKR